MNKIIMNIKNITPSNYNSTRITILWRLFGVFSLLKKRTLNDCSRSWYRGYQGRHFFYYPYDEYYSSSSTLVEATSFSSAFSIRPESSFYFIICLYVKMSCSRHVDRFLEVIHPWLIGLGCSPPLRVFIYSYHIFYFFYGGY